MVGLFKPKKKKKKILPDYFFVVVVVVLVFGFLFCFFETGFFWVALAVLELTL
jgi:preprotein translocase subunit SecE